MDVAGYVMLSRIALQERATSVLANNIANVDTPGFRASRAVFGQQVSRAGGIDGPAGLGRTAYVQDRATWRETQPGTIQQTGNPLDVAITGDGYFAVETPRGERYTRAGRFTLGADGRVLDMQGNPLLSIDGQPLAVAPGDTRLEILGDGTLRSENGPIGRIRVVRFENQQRLRAEGDRHFDAAGEAPLPVDRPALMQGAVEGSNVQAIAEMNRMTVELREYQFATQFMEKEGERMQSVIDRLLRPRA
jgi:flagellar basal-body rod protein FlgF